MEELLDWPLFLFIPIAILVMIAFQLMCLVVLDFDFINPYESASRINKVVLPEFIMQGVLCFLFLVTGHWFVSLLCVPYLYYIVRSYLQKQHLVDVTEIFTLVIWEMKKRLLKLSYFFLLLYVCLFWMIDYAHENEKHLF